jgi:lysophospholipase L1-like esterase
MFTLQKIEINDNPCEFAGHDEICVFDKMLCIGDSLMEGGSKSPNVTENPANAKRTVTRGMYSIPTFITKRFGVVTTNWGISGSTAKSWYNSKSVSEPDWGGYDSALIYIGSNDYTQITTGGMTVEESTAQSTTYLQNIITKLKTDNPGIRIFICTLNPGTTVGTLAPYRIPLMQAIRSIASNDASVFCIDLNEYSSFQAGSAYSNGHPTAIGYQWMFREITNYINWWIAKHPADFKWIRYIGTAKAVTDNVTPEDDDDDGSYDGDVDTGNSGS